MTKLPVAKLHTGRHSTLCFSILNIWIICMKEKLYSIGRTICMIYPCTITCKSLQLWHTSPQGLNFYLQRWCTAPVIEALNIWILPWQQTTWKIHEQCMTYTVTAMFKAKRHLNVAFEMFKFTYCLQIFKIPFPLMAAWQCTSG